jgi:ADP-ribosylglycohydrolase
MALWYKKWLLSRPFDLGINIRATMGCMIEPKEVKDDELVTVALEAGFSSKKNINNRSLMRATPLACWCSDITDIDMLTKIFSKDVSFTHTNYQVHNLVIIYSATIGYLIRNHGNESRATNAYEFALEISKHM